MSIGIGVLSYLVYQLATRGNVWYRILQPGDPPMRILRKLSRAGAGMSLPRVKLNNTSAPAFVLKRYTDGSALVSPEMILTWKAGAGGDVRKCVEDQLNREGKPGVLADAIKGELKKGDSSRIESLEWDKSDPKNASVHVVAKEAIEGITVNEGILLKEKNEVGQSP